MNLKLQTQNFKSQKGNINFIRLLFAVTGLLAFCHVVGLFIGEYAWQWERLFGLDGESNIPTWFSSLLLASCAFVSFRCYEAAEKRDRWIWFLATAGFLFLSCDEVAMLHETVGSIFKKKFVTSESVLANAPTIWPVAVSPLIALGMLWFGVFIPKAMRNSKEALKLVMMGFALYLFATVGLELLEDFIQGDSLSWAREANTLFEESLEMIGAIMILKGLLIQWKVLMSAETPEVTSRFDDENQRLNPCQA
ncbi:MAG: hypothetical protein A3A81_06175 [Omnitrophica bacterium RIFCSPLOWO2_01_FULL_45_10b]|nr:MAG: hypothetical protein A3A81_06175 [Omnitrophica bacterium RIFCSPLOWO2_01_FULL_45_10b]